MRWGDEPITIGKADIKREGSDISVVTLGRMVHLALEAAETLAADGVSVEVLDLRSISPMDEEAILESVRKTRRLVVVDEDNPRCSIATDVVALVASRGFRSAGRTAPDGDGAPHAGPLLPAPGGLLPAECGRNRGRGACDP